MHLTASMPVLLSLAMTASATGADLSVSAQAARVEIDVAPAERQLVRLPALEFAVVIDAACDSGEPRSLSLSVADSRWTWNAASLADDQRIETTLEVPRKQIAPVALESVCSDGVTTEPMLVRGALLAHLSLRCEQEDTSRIHYEVAPLDIELVCAEPAADAMD